MVVAYLAIFFIGCFLLIRSGTWTVRSLTRIAQFLGWREFLVATVIMALATSLPEFFVGVSAAFQGNPELSFGNIIGSNIIALTLVVGISAILAGKLKFEGKILQRTSLYAIIIGVFPLLLLLDGKISRFDGVLLILAFILYFYRLFTQEEKFTKVFSNHFKRKWTNFKLFLKDLLIFLMSLALLLVSAHAIVYSASSLAELYNVPLLIIGLFMLAFGTSIPEICFGLRSVLMGHQDLVLGDVIGSVVVNSTFVLGVTALIYPLEVFDFTPYIAGMIFTFIASILFLVFIKTEQEVSRKEALFLLEVYLLFLLVEIGVEIMV